MIVFVGILIHIKSEGLNCKEFRSSANRSRKLVHRITLSYLNTYTGGISTTVCKRDLNTSIKKR